MDFLDDLKEQQHRRQELKDEEYTFEEYLEMVEQNSNLANNPHQHQSRMILSEGTEYDEDRDVTQYNFFKDELYGIEDVIDRVMTEYYQAAAEGMDVRKRMLLLMGPPGSGKSTFVNMIKRGLEQFTLTEDGAIYGIKGCPQQDDPLALLTLLDEETKQQAEEQLGVTIEGGVCPDCRRRLEDEYEMDPTKFKVERILFDEDERTGIGTYVPPDEKHQDISELVGSVEVAKLKEYHEADPRAYRFDGSLNVANRGLMDFIEVFKSQDEFLNKLLTLCEEKQFKAPRFQMIHADEVVIGHTNETEYERFMSDPQNEAMRRRIKVVKFPYNQTLDAEVKTYEKLLSESTVENELSIAPHTLEAAAHYVLMTRMGIEDPDPLKAIVKAKNGEQVGDMSDEDIEEKLEKLPDNVGMFGLSPTEAIDTIANASMGAEDDYLFFTDILKAFNELVDEHAEEVPNIDSDQLEDFIMTTREVMDEQIKRDVKEAFVFGFEDSAKELFHKYLDYIDAYCEDEPIEDPVTGEDMGMEQAEEFMRSIEEQIGVNEQAKNGFREQIRGHIGSLTIGEEEFDWTAVPQLKEAIEEKLFNDVKDFIRLSTDTTRSDMEAEKRLNAALDELQDIGYSEDAARKAVEYVGQILSH